MPPIWRQPVERRALTRSTQLRIKRIAQPVTEHVDRNHQNHQRQRRKDHQPPFTAEQVVVTGSYQRAERGFGRRQTKAKERKRGLAHYGECDIQCRQKANRKPS